MSLSCVCCCVDQERIVSLVPTGGQITQVHGTWFTSARAGHVVTVAAVTDPHGAATWQHIDWQNATPGASRRTATVPRDAGPVRVTASIDNTRTVDLHFVSQQPLVSETGTPNLAYDTWKCWAGVGQFAEVTATPDPDWYRYRNLFTWTWHDAGATAGNDASVPGQSLRRRRVPLDHAGDTIAVTATLYEDAKTITIRVCQPPVLQLDQLTFDGHVVACDERGDFDRIWALGRGEPNPAVAAVAHPAGARNSVLCFTSGQPITITARLDVLTVPTEAETVTIRGRATVGGTQLLWQDNHVAVGVGGAPVTTGPMVSANLPVGVGRHEGVTITWEMILADGRTTTLRQTTHLIYTLLAAPVAPLAGGTGVLPIPRVYWTLLEFTCRPAHGATTAAKLVAKSYGALKKTTGDGRGPRRARDGQRLSYWLQGRNSAAVFLTRELLHANDGGGRCGSWANLLVDMFAIHGVAARLTCMWAKQNPFVNHLFLVKNCSFRGSGNAGHAPWTHTGHHVAGAGRCSKGTGVAGQGKTNPAFLFPDHAIVEYRGEVYDPSYGMSVHPNLLSWEKAAIAGLGDHSSGRHNFVQAGTALSITNRCSPGFLEHAVAAGETLATIARQYRTTASKLWNHRYNRALRLLRAAPGVIAVGDTVIVPRQGTNISLLRRV